MRFLIFLAACSPAADATLVVTATTNVSAVDEGGVVTVTAMVDSPTAQFRWSAPTGFFGDPAAATTTWTAPSVCADSAVQLTVTVTANLTQQDQTVPVTILDTKGEAQLTEIAVSQTSVVAGDDVSLAINAKAPGCNVESWQWTQTPSGGAFSSPSKARTVWHSGTIDAPQTVELKVKSGTQERSVTISLRMPGYDDVKSLFGSANARCLDCHNDTGRNSGGFNLNTLSRKSTPLKNNCGTGKLIVPGDLNASIFIKRLTPNGCDPDVGARMPYDDTGYFDLERGELVLIQTWVKSGAPGLP